MEKAPTASYEGRASEGFLLLYMYKICEVTQSATLLFQTYYKYTIVAK